MQDTINKRIKYYRKKAKYRQKDVANLLGLKLSTYSKRERLGNVECDMLIKLAEIFDIDIHFLLYGEDFETKNEEKITPVPETFEKPNKNEYVLTLSKEIKDFVILLNSVSPKKRRKYFEIIYKDFTGEKPIEEYLQ